MGLGSRVAYINKFQILINLLIILFALINYNYDFVSNIGLMPYLIVLLIFSLFFSNYKSDINITSAYSFFIFSVSIFILGRFFSYVFSPDEKLYEMSFFVKYKLNDEGALKLTTYVVTAIAFLDIGYRLGKLKNYNFRKIEIDHLWMKKLCKLCLISSPIILYDVISNVFLACESDYLSTKLWQVGDYSIHIDSLIKTIFYICFSYSVTFGYKRKTFIVIFIFMTFSSLYIGARGPIATAALFLIWMLFDCGKSKINCKKLFFTSVFFVFILIFIILFIKYFSARAIYSDSTQSLLTLASGFFYQQGLSLMVFDLSMKIEHYPILAYIQSFIPGSSAIMSLFHPVEYYETSFSHALAHQLNPQLFNSGFGTDWTLFSDFYVFGGMNLVGFCVVALGFGALFSILQNSSEKSSFWYLLLVALFMRLIFLPRSTLTSIIPFSIYLYLFVIVFPKIYYFFKHNIANITNTK
ncbi:O-antigen polysaccharide polymerase Wzy [Vibrio nitrifigilis]|uniref:O-antigen polysaccharide polymerase Wzy n=1 Tax=Vibrio nitrifigilis TaxID=2789781 RepID=A0ABS0GFI4_9VIBR|nr:O-antigen polysaccharide polymerase Wzy [Vibrio nitrifigilis]MBF9001173.1 O-antigen polysaccharide polymerase Wzy [Vibrio nitrifigilis]